MQNFKKLETFSQLSCPEPCLWAQRDEQACVFVSFRLTIYQVPAEHVLTSTCVRKIARKLMKGDWLGCSHIKIIELCYTAKWNSITNVHHRTLDHQTQPDERLLSSLCLLLFRPSHHHDLGYMRSTWFPKKKRSLYTYSWAIWPKEQSNQTKNTAENASLAWCAG